VDARTRPVSLLGLVALIALAFMAASACSLTSPGGGADHLQVVHVTERDFGISAPRLVKAGEVRLVVHNDGPDEHELLIVREAQARPPIRSDGLTVDEETLQPDLVGILEPGGPGSTREIRLHLSPGRYELFCNMAGHFMGGMHTFMIAVP
jgi:uncharacterized cupredoxin-like copper-binding protein